MNFRTLITDYNVLLLLLQALLLNSTDAFYVFAEAGSHLSNMLDELLTKQVHKRASSKITPVIPDEEEACKTIVIKANRPTFGHSGNGTRVEIQQDESVQFVATYVQCADPDRKPCYGTDTTKFSSECVTSFESRHAMIRPLGSTGIYELGAIRVPIMCSCRVRRFAGFEEVLGKKRR